MDHAITCQYEQATLYCHVQLYKYFSTLIKNNTSIYIVNILENKLYIFGWNNFLRGFSLAFWYDLQCESKRTSTPRKQKWREYALISLTTSFYQDMLSVRNSFVHGNLRDESRIRERARIITQNPPKLAKPFASILNVPLSTHIWKPTSQLWDCFHRVAHQIWVTKHLLNPRFQGWLTLKQAYAWAKAPAQIAWELHIYPPWHN